MKNQTVKIEKDSGYHTECPFVLKVANPGYSETLPFCTTYSYLNIDQVKELHQQIIDLLLTDYESPL